MDNMKSQVEYTSKEMLIKAALTSVKIPYYPTAIETEQEVLRRFCFSVMESKWSNRLANALLRGGIKEDIHNMKKILDEAIQKRSEELCVLDLYQLY